MRNGSAGEAVERFDLRGRTVADVDPDAWYSVGREDRSHPWQVFESLPDEAYARRLDAVAPAAVAFGTLGTRKGAAILSAAL